MTLDEAIKHCEEVAEEQDMKASFETDYLCYQMSDTKRNQCKECAEEHRQLAEWLKDYKRLLEQERSRSAEITQYRHDCEKLMEENERLKKSLWQEPCEEKQKQTKDEKLIAMKIKNFKCLNCKHDDFKFMTNPSNRNVVGIYCACCGRWFKWASKDEKNLMRLAKNVKRVDENKLYRECTNPND